MLTSVMRRHFAFNYPCPRKLREIVQMSLIERESKDKIQELWKSYHQEKHNNIAGGLSKPDYLRLIDHLQASPMFIWPV